jgi:uncharacterized protein YaiE (UPF0345 family)
MSTKVEPPVEGAQTSLEAMPPVQVTTVGIPEAEHVGTPVIETEPTWAGRERRSRIFTWALAGVLGLLLIGIGIVALAVRQTTTGAGEYLGEGTAAWQEYRAGERGDPVASGRMGLSTQAWQDYRAGERTALTAAGQLGLSGPAWREYRTAERADSAKVLTGLTVPAWQEYRTGERTA